MEYSEAIERVVEDIHDIKKLLERFVDRVIELEKWRTGTEEILDSILERVGSVEDKVDRNTEFMNQSKGGMAAKTQLIATIFSAAGMLALLIKILFKL